MTDQKPAGKRGPKPIAADLTSEVTISLRITKLQRDALEQLAREHGKNMKEMLIMAMDRYVESVMDSDG